MNPKTLIAEAIELTLPVSIHWDWPLHGSRAA